MRRLLSFKSELEFKEFAQNLQRIEEEVLDFKQNLTQRAPRNAILILGPTGSGKSTVMNILNGHAHAYHQISLNFEGKVVEKWCIEPVLGSEPKAENASKIAKVNCEPVSETSTPNFSNYENTLLIDCPGFSDTRGWSRALTNYMLIDVLFRHFEGIQIIFVESSLNLIENRGNVFFENLRCLLSLFEADEFHKLKEALTFVFSRGERLDYLYQVVELLRGRRKSGFVSEQTVENYEGLFRFLEANGAVLNFPAPPALPESQTHFFSEFRAALSAQLCRNKFKRLVPAKFILDAGTKLKLLEMKSIARLSLEHVLFDAFAFFQKAINSFCFEKGLVALKLNFFFTFWCENLLKSNKRLTFLDKASIHGFEHKYAEVIPGDCRTVCRIFEGMIQLSLTFEAFDKAGMALEPEEKFYILNAKHQELREVRLKIVQSLKSYRTFLRKPAMVGAGAITTGVVGSTALLEGATALTMGFLAFPLATLSAGTYYVKSRIKEIERLIEEITPMSIFD